MKKLSKIIGLLLIFQLLIVSCWDTEVETNRRDYIIRNDTDFIVNIRFYSKHDGKLNNQTSGIIDSGEQLSEKVELTVDFDNSEDYPRLAFSADSVKITLDNEKYYTCTFNTFNSSFSEPINRNLFRHSNYENLGNERYLFKITQQDYENAIPCNGNCD